MIYVHCDGSITGGAWGKKTGEKTLPHSWIGWVARHLDGTFIHHHTADLGEGADRSGNVSEHMSVNSALRWLKKDYSGHVIRIHTDSQLIVGQLSGAFQVHNELLSKIAAATKDLHKSFVAVEYYWVPREKNKYADAVSKALQPKFAAKFPNGLPATELPPEFIEKWR